MASKANKYKPLIKQKHKQCPVLDALGIFYNNSNAGIPICKNCQIPYCVFDRWDARKAVDEEDWQKLLTWRDELLELQKLLKGGDAH